jgi:predicted nuclease with TOPRIM domain
MHTVDDRDKTIEELQGKIDELQSQIDKIHENRRLEDEQKKIASKHLHLKLQSLFLSDELTQLESVLYSELTEAQWQIRTASNLHVSDMAECDALRKKVNLLEHLLLDRDAELKVCRGMLTERDKIIEGFKRGFDRFFFGVKPKV